jgi:predicted DNA-binding antitoxin AbrB/MazE fold protein
MPVVIDAVYENGVLKPLVKCDLKDHQRYQVTLYEVEPLPASLDDAEIDQKLDEEINRRTTVLPDGSTIVRLRGILTEYAPATHDLGELLADAMAEVRRERAAHFQEELDEFFPLTMEADK